MKKLQEYIIESSQSFESGLSGELYKICEELTRYLDYDSLEIIKEQDPNRFDISKENEQLLIDSFANARVDYKAISSSEYYGIVNKEKDWESLSGKEKSDFYTQNGNIIIVDKDNKPVYFIDVRISEKYFGTVSLGSLVNFNEDGCYICINKNAKQSRFVSHKALSDAVKENHKLLKAPIKGKQYEGYKITWEGEDLTSEYFVPSNQIAKFNQ